jgi:Gpi18-like mannosyltransferase
MRKLTIWLVVAFAFRFILSFLIWHPDLNTNADWGIRFFQYGPAGFFSPEANVWSFTWPNQPPGTIYMFAGIRKLYEGTFGFLSYLHFHLHAFPGSTLLYLEQNLYPAMLKFPAILADLGIGYLIYKIVGELTGKQKLSLAAAVIWLFNPVSWYNSAVWGQYDAVINFLALLAVYLLVKKKLVWSLVFFALSIYTKASLLIFAPLFAIISLRQRYILTNWIKSLIVVIVFIGLVTSPFSRGEPFGWLYNLYQHKVFSQQLQIITANGFNIWAAITGISEQPQTLPFLGLTYQYWSYILFAVFYLPCLWAVFKKQDLKTVIWSFATAAFASFMLLTNMHERYLYPLFPYFTVLIVTQFGMIWNYFAISLINILNLYNFWWVPFIPGLQAFMSAKDRLAPRVLGGLGFMLFLFFYLRFVRFNLSKENK